MAASISMMTVEIETFLLLFGAFGLLVARAGNDARIERRVFVHFTLAQLEVGPVLSR